MEENKCKLLLKLSKPEKILEVLERDKPKKPIEIQDEQFGDFTLCCPNCKKQIINVWSNVEYKPNGCHYCLQRFDWSKKEKDL